MLRLFPPRPHLRVPMRHLLFGASIFATMLAAGGMSLAGEGQLEIRVLDKDSGKPIACRMHLKTAGGKVKLPPRSVPVWDDHFIIPGSLAMKLPLGNYTFELERGPEYALCTGNFTINNYSEDSKDVSMQRHADMAAEGWWSGDLDVRRGPKEAELLMNAEDLHVLQLTTWWNDHSGWTPATLPKEPLLRWDDNRLCHLLAGQHVRPGGTLLYLNLSRPLPLGGPSKEHPPTSEYVEQIRKQPGAWIDCTRPYGWDVPVLAALGQLDSIEVAHGNLGRKKVVAEETGGKPRDPQMLVGPRGHALWGQQIYFHLLNCGLRIPPSAGSGSGITPNPVGYNRLYVHIDGDFSYEKWWKGFRAGRVTVTNGPLMRSTVHGKPPGEVFQAPAGQTLEFEIGLTLSTREPMSYLELIKDGRVEQEIRFDQYAQSGRLPKMKFDRSGWFAIRAVADIPNNYRFALSAPYYVEIGEERRISKRSAQFFLDWVVERARRLNLPDEDQRREVLEVHRRARDFWRELVERANAE